MADIKYSHSMVICGFPGIGKTTVAESYKNASYVDVVDFDSAMYKSAINYDGLGLRRFNRNTMSMETVKWYIGYVDEIESMILEHERACETSDKNKMLIILVSTHDEVRQELASRGLNYTIVVPGKGADCKQIYLERLNTRYTLDKTPANLAAYDAMVANYDKFVSAVVDHVAPPSCDHVVVLAKNETLSNFMRQITSNMMLGSLLGIAGIGTSNKPDLSNFKFHRTTGANGELIIYTDPIDIDSCVVDDGNGNRKIDNKALTNVIYQYTKAAGWQSASSAFAGCPFITLSKEDAKLIINMQQTAIDMIHNLMHSKLIAPEDIFDAPTLKAYSTMKSSLDGINVPYEIRDIEQARLKEQEEAKQKEITTRRDVIVADSITSVHTNRLISGATAIANHSE